MASLLHIKRTWLNVYKVANELETYLSLISSTSFLTSLSASVTIFCLQTEKLPSQRPLPRNIHDWAERVRESKREREREREREWQTEREAERETVWYLVRQLCTKRKWARLRKYTLKAHPRRKCPAPSAICCLKSRDSNREASASVHYHIKTHTHTHTHMPRSDSLAMNLLGDIQSDISVYVVIKNSDNESNDTYKFIKIRHLVCTFTCFF